MEYGLCCGDMEAKVCMRGKRAGEGGVQRIQIILSTRKTSGFVSRVSNQIKGYKVTHL